MATNKIRLMVVDDHEVVRTGLRAILEPEDDIEVVAEAPSAVEAARQADAHQPNVVLMDVRMEGMNGIEACRIIKNSHPDMAVLMLTSFSEEEAVTSAIMAGASGFLLKNVGRAELLKAIRAVGAGQSLLDPAVTRSVIDRYAKLLESERDRAVDAISDREREVITLVAQGMTNRQIAEQLVISENTARNHVSRILEKLNLTRRSEAAVFAAQHGLLPEDG
ncbi:MAG: response regulator transcription factor [SAR202 cluster bacterium]|nr:response regulator transcription factor [SAR202 cluster bacterium]MDP6662705.1 response regulator transcription factor [SAR202 cluster bacterium]MDP6799444.1 response regulator transcription factor [SAR202 cluster bacterium]